MSHPKGFDDVFGKFFELEKIRKETFENFGAEIPVHFFNTALTWTVIKKLCERIDAIEEQIQQLSKEKKI